MNRKTIGAFYTPAFLARAITDVFIRDGSEKVIDPSFGGCAFIEAAHQKFIQLGVQNSEDNIFGCDVDPTAFEILSNSKIPFNTENFYDNDFLDQAFDTKFDLIVGNPPYIKHDHIPRMSYARANKILEHYELSIVRPNYWLYFLLKSISILKEGGSIVFVLPQSFYTAEYSKILAAHLSSSFKSIDVLPITEQIFEGTNEIVCVVIFNSFQLNSIITPVRLHKSYGKNSIINGLKIAYQGSSLIVDESKKILEEIRKENNLPLLGEVAEIKIGTVTGDKKYFILKEERAKELNLPQTFLRKVVSNASDLDKITDAESVLRLPYILCIPKDYKIDGLYSYESLDMYIKSATKKTIESNHAKNRKPWYSLRLTRIPDGFIKNLSNGKHRIYENKYDLMATNNILGIFNCQIDIEILAVLSRSKFFSISADISSIDFGRKAKKLDPRHAKSIVIPYNREIGSKIKHIVTNAKQGEITDAQIDDIIYQSLKENRKFIDLLKKYEH